MRSRGRLSRVAAVAAALAVLTVTLGWLGPSASAEGGCTNYPRYAALGSAGGMRAVESAPGVTIVSDFDGNLSGAQAQYDSVLGSLGWAGAAYSATAAENVGAVKLTPNQLPLIVASSYPADPQPDPKSAGTATVTAKSGPDSSTANSSGGGPASDQQAAGHVDAAATALCADDGSLQAVADNTADAISIGGVLQIGAVRSHAKVVVDAQGQPKFETTMDIEGVTVLGQPAAITDQGTVVGSSVIPTPANPLEKALTDAGVTVHYVAAVKDPATGEAFAPGLEIVVTRETPGVGAGTKTTSYTLGRAYAMATLTPGDTAATTDVAAPTITPSTITPSTSPSHVTPTAVTVAATPKAQAAPAPAAAGRSRASTPTSRIANWSIAPAYSALALGAIALLAVRLLFERLAARFRWT